MTVWDIVKHIPVYEVKLHTGPITKIHWNEEEELLYTASKDKTLKVIITLIIRSLSLIKIREILINRIEVPLL